MATNLAIDDNLLNEAVRVGGQRTKKATVTEALREYIQRRKQAEIVKVTLVPLATVWLASWALMNGVPGAAGTPLRIVPFKLSAT